jgi:hypothetical protein
MDKISERGELPRNPFAIRFPEVNGAIGSSETRTTVGPVAEIEAETGWIEAETRIAADGTTAVNVLTVAVAVTTEAGDRTVVVGAAAGAITRF